MRRSLRRRSPVDFRILTVARELIQKSEDRGIPSCRSDARSTNQLRKADVWIKRSVRFLNENRMIDDSEQRQVVDTVSDADAFNPVGLVSQPLLPPITT